MSRTISTTTNAAASAAMQQPVRMAALQDEPTTLVEMFERTLSLHNKADLLNYKRDGAWRSISTEAFVRRARDIALGLYALGLRRTDRVALLAENCPEWTLTDAASLYGGMIDVPIYPTLTPHHVSYIVNDCGARVLFIQNREKYDRVKDAIHDCPALEHIVFFDGEGAQEAGALTLAEIEANGRARGAEQPHLSDELAEAAKPDDLATIIYTSGTTGEPKGVMLTHANLTTNLIDSSGHLSFSENDIVLSVLPFSHVFERLAMYMYIFHGMSVFYAESMDRIGDNLREVRPTIMLCVPRLFEKIYARIKDKAAEGGKIKTGLLMWAVSVGRTYVQHTLEHQRIPPLLAFKYRLASKLVFSKWREAVGGRIRLFVSGGAALPDDIGYVFASAGLPIVQGYGLTETSPVICAGTLEENRIGTVGRPIKNVEVRIASDGEIEARGPNIMRGYYNKPEATAAVFTEDGWFKTGDIGALDAQGFLRITDRKKELFKTSGGKYVAPQPIEQRIKGSRFVNQVVLIGDGRKFPSALIVPDWEQLRAYAQLKGLSLSAPEEFCRHPRILDLFQRQVDSLTEDLAQYERVKRIALLERELTIEGGEMTPTLKIKRRVVNEKYRDVIDRLYADAESSSGQ